MSSVLASGQNRLSPTGAALAGGLVGLLDPRLRLVVCLAFAVVTVGLTQMVALAAALGVSAAVLVLSRLPVGPTLRRMAMMDGFILFMLVMLPFTVPGEPAFTVFGIGASWQGIWRAVEIALTANAVVLMVLSLVGTLEPVTLGHALHALRCPERLVHLLMFTIRYIDVLREEYLRLRISMKMRGFRPRTNWHTYRSFGYLVGMMMVRAMERSERILTAMKCRGFTGRLVLLERFRLTAVDFVFAGGMVLVLAALVWLNVVYVAD